MAKMATLSLRIPLGECELRHLMGLDAREFLLPPQPDEADVLDQEPDSAAREAVGTEPVRDLVGVEDFPF